MGTGAQSETDGRVRFDQIIPNRILRWMLYAAAWTIIGLVNFGNRYRERGQRLAEAQLQNLRDQLNPHFLFNTLNMISSKMYEDVGQAHVMITRLSDLLRLTLRTSSQPEVPLQTDLEALDLYLDIMKARFADDIRIEVNVDPSARDALAPSLIL